VGEGEFDAVGVGDEVGVCELVGEGEFDAVIELVGDQLPVWEGVPVTLPVLLGVPVGLAEPVGVPVSDPEEEGAKEIEFGAAWTDPIPAEMPAAATRTVTTAAVIAAVLSDATLAPARAAVAGAAAICVLSRPVRRGVNASEGCAWAPEIFN
jgi:hypothetical protein